MENTPVKTCTKCGETYPATTEFFRKQAKCRFGVTSQCKQCEKAYHAARYLDPEKGPKIQERNRAWHRAHAKPRPVRTPEEKRQRQREMQNALLAQHPERRRKYRAAWLAKPESREYLRAYHEANPERRREYAKRWRTKNPDKVRTQARNRRARKKAAEGTHTAADVQLKFQQQQGKCYWCGKRLDSAAYHADHIIALAKGGSNGPENLCCACPSCNLSKHDKTPWEFTGRLL